MAARDAAQPRGAIRPSRGTARSRRQLVQGFAASLSQKNKTTCCERKSVKDGMTREPMAPLQTSSTMHSVNSSGTPWLQKMGRLKAVRDPDRLWRQRFCSAPAKSDTANTFDHSRHFRKGNVANDWLTLKGFCGAKVTPGPSRDIIASVQCVLDRENAFVREMDKYFRHDDFLNLRKKEIVYREWFKDVSEPLLQKIEDKMASQPIEEVQKRKREQFSQYLNYCNKKGYVILDYFDPADYDPFSMTTDGWKV